MLANVLGEISGFVSVGEVRFLWQRGIVQNRLCGCGEHVSDCAFWNEVLDAALGPGSRLVPAGPRHPPAPRARAAHPAADPASHLLRDGGARVPSGGGELDDVLDRLYASIAAVAGANVVVDSSKLPTYASLLGGLDGIDLRVAHFLRDPRAAAYSWRRRKYQSDLGPDALMERRGIGKSAAAVGGLEPRPGADVQRQPRRPTPGSPTSELLADPEVETRRLLDALDLAGRPRPGVRRAGRWSGCRPTTRSPATRPGTSTG